MGNKQPQSIDRSYQWQWLSNQSGIQLYKHKLNGIISEKRSVLLDNRYGWPTQHEIYSYRQNNDKGLVKVYSAWPVSNKTQEGICDCAKQTKVNVYSERITHRLTELPQLSFPNSIYVLQQMLSSYEVIYKKFGPLNINQQLVGVNQQGQIKVWVNENWAMNHPSHILPKLKSAGQYDLQYSNVAPDIRDESQMLANLYDVVQEKTEQGRFPAEFGKNLKQKKSFREAKKYVSSFVQTELHGNVPFQLSKAVINQSFSTRQGVVPPRQEGIHFLNTQGAQFIKGRLQTIPGQNLNLIQNNVQIQRIGAPQLPKINFQSVRPVQPISFNTTSYESQKTFRVTETFNVKPSIVPIQPQSSQLPTFQPSPATFNFPVSYQTQQGISPSPGKVMIDSWRPKDVQLQTSNYVPIKEYSPEIKFATKKIQIEKNTSRFPWQADSSVLKSNFDDTQKSYFHKYSVNEPSLNKVTSNQPSYGRLSSNQPSFGKFATYQPSFTKMALDDPYLNKFALDSPYFNKYTLQEVQKRQQFKPATSNIRQTEQPKLIY